MVVNRSFCLISHTAGQQSLHYPDNTHMHAHVTHTHKVWCTSSSFLSRTHSHMRAEAVHSLPPWLYRPVNTAACRASASLFVCRSAPCPACLSPAAKVSIVGKSFLHLLATEALRCSGLTLCGGVFTWHFGIKQFTHIPKYDVSWYRLIIKTLLKTLIP